MSEISNNPLVSVIIPTYKRSTMLPQAIRSVLTQSYKNIQVIVVDDNDPQTDWRKQTEKLMLSYNDDLRVKYVKHTRNSNGSVARNTGIQNADGEIVCFLDDDDIYLENKTQKQVNFLLSHPEYHAVYCGWDRDGVTIPTATGDCSFEVLSGASLIYSNVIMMWKKDAVECGGWDISFKRHQEAAFMLRYFRNGGLVGVVRECLVKFDTSDRSNAAANGKINEEHTNHYLSSYKDVIARCERKRPGSERDIYSYRYRGVFLNYLLEHDFKSALDLWWRMTRKMPFKFNADLVKYALNRVKHN